MARKSRASTSRRLLNLAILGALLLVGGYQIWKLRQQILSRAASAPAGTATSLWGDADVRVNEKSAPLATLDPELQPVLERAENALASGRGVEGRTQLNQLLPRLEESDAAERVRGKLAQLGHGLFFGTDILAGDPYQHLAEIQPGDTFVRLARRYKVTSALLAQINPGLSPRSLRPGTGLKVVHGPFHARVLKKKVRIDLYLRDLFVGSYSFQGSEFLSSGLFRVRNGGKVPVRPGEAQGFWIGLEGLEPANRSLRQIGFLGTSELRSSSVYGGSGFMRLQDSDLQELYNALIEVESLVRIDP